MKKNSSFIAERNRCMPNFRLFQLAAVIATYTCMAPLAYAADTAESTWAGSSSGSWTDPTNWGSGVPSAAVSAEFNSTFTNQPTLSANATVQGIWVTGSGSTGVGGLTSITGGTIALGNTATLNGNANTSILLDGSGKNSLSIGAVSGTGLNILIAGSNSGTLTIGTLTSSGSSGVTDDTFTNNSTVASTITITNVAAMSGINTITGSNALAVFNLGSSALVSGSSFIISSYGTTNIMGTFSYPTAPATEITNGTVNITGSGSLTKGVTLNSGILNVGDAGGVGGALAISGGNLILGNKAALTTTAVSVTGAASISSSTSLTGANSVANSLTVTSTTGLTLGGANAAGGANDLTFNGGNFSNSDTNTLTIGSGSNITFSGATFTDLSRNNNTAHTFTINGGGNLTLSDVVTSTGQSTAIGNENTMLYAGTGTLTFSSSTGNTYTGTTTVSSGVFAVTNGSGSATGTGTVVIGGISGGGSKATLEGTGIISGVVATSSANSNVGHIAPGVNTSGNFGSTGTLTLGTAGLTIGAGTALDFDLSGSLTGNDLISMGGGLLTFGGTSGSKIVLNVAASAPLLTGASNAYTLISNASGTSSGFNASFISLGSITGNSTSDTAVFENTANGLEVYFSSSNVSSSPAFVSPTAPLKIMTGASTTVGATLQNNAASTNPMAVSLSNSSTGGVGSVTSFSSSNPSTIAANSSAPVSGTFTASGSGVGTWGITETDSNSSPSTTASTSGTVTVYSKSASGLSTSTANFGDVHQGATVTSPTTSLENTASGTYAAGLQVTGLGGLTGTAVGTVIAPTGSVALNAAVSTSVTGTYNQAYSITSTDDQSIIGYSADTTQTFTVSGFVYSGTGTWNTNGGGAWGTLNGTGTQSFAYNWVANGGSPGLDPNYKTTDSASFGSASTSGTATITLLAASPYLNAITFNDSAASYDIEQGVGGTGLVHLDSTSTATVTVSAGSHTIGAPIELDSAAATSVASTDTLTINGAISQNGTQSLAIGGAGTTVLSGSNSYSGGTTVGAGTLLVSNANGSATGSGALTVSPGATIGGYGTSSGSSFNISGTSGSTANVLVGLTSASDTNTTQKLTLLGTGASTIAYANLTFNLNALTNTGSTAGTQLAVGGSSITFGSSVKFTLDMQNQPAVVAAFTPYVLIAGTGTTTDSNGTSSGQYSGLTLGAVTNAVGGGTDTVITGSNLQLAFGGSVDESFYGAHSYLVLYQNGSADDIEVMVVPEPGTWAMMLGGLAVLVFWQLRRRA